MSPPAPPPAEERPAAGSRRRWLWRAGIAVALLLALRIALPFAAEWAAESAGSDALGRRVEIGDVDLSLLAGRIALEDVAVGPLASPGEVPAEFSPDDAFFRLARLDANLGWLGLLTGEIRLESVELTAPQIVAVRGEDGRMVPVLRPAVAEPDEEPSSGLPLPLRIDHLEFSELEAYYVNLARPGQRPLEIDFEDLSFDGVLLRGEEIEVADISLQNPRVRVLRDVDLTTHAGEPEQAAAESAKAEAGAPPKLRLSVVDIAGAHLALVTGSEEIEATLGVHAEGITLTPGESFPLHLTIGIGAGSIDLKGAAALSPPGFEGRLAWSDLPLAVFTQGAEDLSPVSVDHGASSGNLEISFASAPTLRVGAAGSVGVKGLALEDRAGAFTLGFASLDVGIDELALTPGAAAPKIALSKVALAKPKLKVVRRAVASDSPEPAASEAEAAPAPAESAEAESAASLLLGLLEVRDGSVEFDDETLSPQLRSKLTKLQVDGKGLRWPERQVESFALRARGPGQSAIALDAQRSASSGQAKLTLTGVRLPPFSPYAADAAGYRIEKGQLTIDGDAAIEGERTQVTSRVELTDLAVDELEAGSFEKIFGVPLDLGLALLRDPRGRIVVPVRLTLEGAGSRVDATRIVASGLRQAILGALTSPLKAAGLVVGRFGKGKGESGAVEPLAMLPGAAELEPEAVSQLPALAQLLSKRPELGLSLRGSVGPDDEAALAERVLQEQVVADAKLPPVDAGLLQRRRLRGALEERAAGRAGELDAEDARALERWVAAVDVTPERRAELAQERAEAVLDALASEYEVDPRRLSVGEPETGSPGVVVGFASAPE